MDFPRIRAVPDVGKIKRISNLIVVDFPAPLARETQTRRRFAPAYSGFPGNVSFSGAGTRTGSPWRGFRFQWREWAYSYCSRAVPHRQRTPGVSVRQQQCPKKQKRGFPRLFSPASLPGRQRSSLHLLICTRPLRLVSTACWIGFKVCSARQLSRIPTCCTQLTVHLGAHPLWV